ncbi:MAG: cobalamin biosynthesis protein CobD [Desulfotalea sp.]|nr:MAG: cobalamin biosynthesis protein CobD [Desulfotalea sp.]
MDYSIQLTLCLVLDFILGDPRWYPHPVRGIGWLCSKSELLFRKYIKDVYLAGFLTVCAVISSTAIIVITVLVISLHISVSLEQIIAVVFIYMALSTKDLLVHSNHVYTALLSSDPIANGRREVAKIVGRDTGGLNQEGIARACIETVGENMVDGSTSPLFFAVLASLCSPLVALSPIGCSAVGIFAYKAINTMDSMIGYKNEHYILFGRVAAKLDDIVNYLPARMSGLCLIASAYLLRLDGANATKIYFRDNDKHSSPNAAHPEAAVAGALTIQLGGPSSYFGEIVEKPFIGDTIVQISHRHIKQVNRLVVVGILIFTTCLLGCRYLLYIVAS